MIISPLSGLIAPIISRINVVLPDPEGPRRHRISPALAVNEMSFNIVFLPSAIETLDKTMLLSTHEPPYIQYTNMGTTK
jgi:hypothetical protein